MIRLVKASGMGLVVGPPRRGYQVYGIPEGGAINSLSMSRMNLALGNKQQSAGIELTGHFKMQVHSSFGLMCGPAGANVLLNGRALPGGRFVQVHAEDLIEILPPSEGLWTQIAFHGGLDVPVILGSSGLCMAGGFGGQYHRLLKSGDSLNVLQSSSLQAAVAVALPSLPPGQDTIRIMAMQGPEYDALQGFAGRLPDHWTMSPNSNRMGYRFDSEHRVEHTLDMGSSYACTAGLVQMPPNGQIVVLMADAQVTGGYPRYAAILQSELWKVSLLQPGQTLEFDWVSLTQACQYNKKAQSQWQRFEQAILANRG